MSLQTAQEIFHIFFFKGSYSLASWTLTKVRWDPPTGRLRAPGDDGTLSGITFQRGAIDHLELGLIQIPDHVDQVILDLA